MMTAAEREAFMAKRRTMIGGSDAAAVYSFGYGCQRRLVMQKRGVTPDYEPEETLAMERGREMEDIIARKYAAETGRRVEQVGTRRHPQYPFLGVHMDRVVWRDDRPDPGYLEIKCLAREMFHRTRKEGLIDDYLLQEQHGLMVTDFQWGSFAVFWPDGWRLLWWDVDRDHDLIEDYRPAAIAVWAQITGGTSLPERLPPGDKRCSGCEFRKSCQGAAMLALIEEEVTFESDDSLAGLAAEYMEAQVAESEAKDRKKEISEQLKTAMDERQGVATRGARITYKAYERKGYSIPAGFVRPLRVYPA